MKKYIEKIIKIIILLILIIASPLPKYTVQAAEGDVLETDIINGNLQEKFNPNNGLTGAEKKIAQPFTKLILKIVNAIVGIIQVIGGLLTIVSIAIYGFYMVVRGNETLASQLNIGGNRGGNPKVRQVVSEFGTQLVIGAILLFMSSTIVKFVLSIFM